MAAKKDDKPQVPKHIQDYISRSEQAEMLLDTLDLHHAKAYTAAADKHLRETKKVDGKDVKGNVKYDLMNNAKIRKAMLDEMADYYTKVSSEALKTTTTDFHERELLTKAYMGVTRAQLHQYGDQFKSEFTLSTYTNRIMPQMRQAQQRELAAASQAHITDDHIDDIVKHVGAGDIVHKDKLRREDAIGLLETYRKSGGIPKKGLSQIIADYAIKDPKYK